jgi:hypothetical protein
LKSDRAFKWYNRFSKVYTLTNDYPYTETRIKAIDELELKKGDVVIDLFCGTGVNFKGICSKIKEDGIIIGIDGSSGMLSKARETISGIDNPSSSRLFEKDLQKADHNFFTEIIPSDIVPKILITLGPGGMPGWETFWQNLFSAVPSGTRFVTMDVFCKKGSLSGAIINFVGAGSWRIDVSSHKPWRYLAKNCDNYRKSIFRPFKLLNCDLVVASGQKK